MHRMRYVERNLTEGETVVYQTRLHWIVMLHHIVIAAIAAGLGGLMLSFASTQSNLSAESARTFEIVAGVLLASAVVTLILGAIQRNSTEMAVTNRRVIIKVGLVGRRTVEMLLSKIESIEVKETALGRMLGYGTIVVIGTGGTPEPFYRVAHPLQFRSMVQQQIEGLAPNPRETFSPATMPPRR
jgi:uncharacterized membrane protein YdbT with pleckstrin-like domain